MTYNTARQNRSGGLLARLGTVALATVATLGFSASLASADGSVQWTDPANNSTFTVGTEVMPEGTADGFGTGGGLDLALVLDASGSMTINNTSDGVTKRRQQWQADAAKALVNSLPSTNTSVAVAQFTGSGFLRQGLTSTADTTPILDAIDNVGAGGGTNIPNGMSVGQTELVNNGTAGRSKQMVVISDGSTSGNVTTAAQSAAGDDITVHSVAIPGASISTMQTIANEGGGVFVDFSDPSDLTGIENFFSGAGGNFVGVSQVDITMPDGTVLSDVGTDAFGNFKTPGWNMLLGNNVFEVTAFFDDQSEASASLTLVGIADTTTTPIPLPAGAWLLLSGLAGLGLARRGRRDS